jgi:lysozyme
MTPPNFGPTCLAIATPALKGFEAFRSRPYLDSAALWTIAFGCRCLANGDPVTHSTSAVDTIQGDAIMAAAIGRVTPRLERLVTRALLSHQAAAVLCFAYNVGTGALAGSTLLRLLNAGDMAGAAAQFLVWDMVTDPNSKRLVVSAGLVARRAQERRMFLGADLSPTALVTLRHPQPTAPGAQPGADALMAAELRAPIS